MAVELLGRDGGLGAGPRALVGAAHEDVERLQDLASDCSTSRGRAPRAFRSSGGTSISGT